MSGGFEIFYLIFHKRVKTVIQKRNEIYLTRMERIYGPKTIQSSFGSIIFKKFEDALRKLFVLIFYFNFSVLDLFEKIIDLYHF